MALDLAPHQRELLVQARRATLVTIAPDGRPRPVPCCFARLGDGGDWSLVTPIDDKPKAASDPLRLARVRDLRRDPRVALLVDRWDEDWTRLAWLRVEGRTEMLAAGASDHQDAVVALRARYPQYLAHRLEDRPIIRIVPDRVRGWSAHGA